MSKVTNYISEAFEELRTNVTWPEWADVQKYTVVVAVFSVVFALATAGVDKLFEEGLAAIFTVLK
ncbi:MULTISPECIES: preprotein translocase subunit SecE [Flavobacterium]|uniref:Preprotein translocase subunit SecE n=1 Tax=Flavobacterium aurantiibacter TaxID=2023067 RepID=A0A256ABD5_9FLAO|nr:MULTISPECIES: preprotein translocase subunit SecE [Flavobacterium]OYQ50941.1 preprotein translocase subunit SecE [Flavobacterium aurantiibacter]